MRGKEGAYSEGGGAGGAVLLRQKSTMGNTKNEIRNEIRSVAFDLTDTAAGGATERCVNLIEVRSGGTRTLRPAPATTLRNAAAWRPLHIHHRDGAVDTFFTMPSTSEEVTLIGVQTGCEGDISIVGAASGDLCAPLSLSACSVAVSCGGRRRTLSHTDGKWRLDDIDTGLRLPRLTPRINGRMAASTGPMTFKLTDAAHPSLTTSHVAELSQRLGDCYSELAAGAGASGLWIQPMLVAVRLTDGNGAVMAETPPLLMAPSGWQLDGELTAEPTLTDNTLTIGDMRLEADGYVIDIEMPAASDGSGAAYAEVIAMPQHHPLDTGDRSPVRLLSRTDGLKLTTALPGATLHFASRRAERRAALVAEAPHTLQRGSLIGRFDLKAVAGTTVTLRAGTATGGDMTKNSVNTQGATEFTARAVARSGDAILWGDITLLRGAMTDAAIFMADSRDGGTWQCAVEVTDADGSRHVTQTESSGPMPVSLLPLVSYPSRRAVSLRIIVEDEEGTRSSVTVALTPAADGSDMSCYLGDDLAEIALTPTAYDLPAETAADCELRPADIMLSRADDPLRPVATLTLGSATVRFITAAVRSRSAWDAQRSRFLVFTDEGVTAVTANASTGHLGATLIDSTLTASPRAVATTPQGTVCASGRRLVICGSNTVTECAATDHEVTALARHSRLELLAALDSQGNTWLYRLDAQGRAAGRTLLPLPVAPVTLSASADGEVWAPCGSDGLRLIGTDPAESTPVALTSTACVDGLRRATALAADLGASRFSGSLELTASGAGGSAAIARRVVRLDLDGEVRHPVAARVAAPPRRRLTLNLDAEVSADFSIVSATVHTVRARRPV